MRSQHFCQKYEKITPFNGKTSNTSPNTYDPQILTSTSCPQQTADSDRRIRQLRWIPKHVNGPGVLWWAMRDFSLMLSVTYEKESWGYRRTHKGNLSSWLERGSIYPSPQRLHQLHSFAQEETHRNATKSPGYLSCSTIPATRWKVKPCSWCLLTVRRFEASTSIIPRKRFWQSGGIKWGMWNTPRFTFSSSCRKLSSSKGRAPCRDGTEQSMGEKWRGPKEKSQDKHGEIIEKRKSVHNELS